MAEKTLSVGAYLIIWAALVALTVVTVLLSYAGIGAWTTLTSLGIAAVQAILLVLYFMHGRSSTGVVRIAVVAGLLWLGILLVGTANDYLTRGWLAIPGK